MAERLREAREKAGFISAAAAAEAFGWTESAYRHHENGTRGFDVPTAKRYGRAFKVNPGWLLALDAIPTMPAKLRDAIESRVAVTGSVAAGVWKETTEWPKDKQFDILVSPSPFPGSRRFGLQVEGHSMDLQFPPGTLLDCVSIFDVGIEPASGDYVIVERIRSDGLHELTVKRFHIDDSAHHWLVPESSKPEFQSPIPVGRPDVSHENDEEIRVIAFVIGDYKPRAGQLLSRYRK